MTLTEGGSSRITVTPERPKLRCRRVMTMADLEVIRPAFIEFHKESRFGDIPYSDRKFEALYKRAINNPKNTTLLIAEFKGELVGLIYCTIGEYIFGHTDLIANVLAFNVRKKFRDSMLGGRAAVKLLNGATAWSKKCKATQILISVTSGINIMHTDQFLSRVSFEYSGGNYLYICSPPTGMPK